MDTPLACPACLAPLEPGAIICPICQHKRTKDELNAEADAQAQKSERSQNQMIRNVLLAGAAAAALYAAPKAQKLLAASKEKTAAIAVVNPSVEGAADKFAQAAPGAASAPAAPVVPAPAAPAPAAPPAVPEKPKGWRVHGKVYDLLSLKPAAAAQVVFQDPSGGPAVEATTDANGEYAASLPKLSDGGYRVAVRARGYKGSYLEEGSPPYPERSRARREQVLSESLASEVLHVPVTPDESGEAEYNAALYKRR